VTLLISIIDATISWSVCLLVRVAAKL